MGGRELPRGIEVLVKKAAVDPEFKALLLEARAGAAGQIGLELAPEEAAMLAAIPASQLKAIISSTKVDGKARPAFLGRAAALMIAALGVGELAGCDVMIKTRGIDPDRPTRSRPEKDAEEKTEADDGDE